MAHSTEPTAKQSETLSHIRQHIAQHGYSPTIAELAAQAGVHPNAIDVRLCALRRKCLITSTPRITRSIRPVE